MSFSDRSRFASLPNALHEAVTGRKARGQPIIDVTVSNPTEASLVGLAPSALREALVAETVAAYAPDPFGMPGTRERLAHWLSRRGLCISPTRLCLTASTSEAYGFLFKLLCDPGDCVLVPTPSYPLLEYLAALECVRLVPYELSHDGEWFVDRHAIEHALSEAGGRAKAIVTIHPNNPTGNYLKPAELDLLAGVCAGRDLALISDEVFYEHPLELRCEKASRAAAQSGCLTFSLGGLSKLAGLPQLKLGWIAANGPRAELDEAMSRLELIADTWLSVSAPAQLALPHVLAHVDEFVSAVGARLRQNLAALDSALSAAPSVTRLRCEGGWIALLRVPLLRELASSEAWALRFLDAGVLVQPGYFYGLAPDAYLAVSLLCEPERFSQGVSAMVSKAQGVEG